MQQLINTSEMGVLLVMIVASHSWISWFRICLFTHLGVEELIIQFMNYLGSLLPPFPLLVWFLHTGFPGETSNISITRKLVRNTCSWTPPQTCWARNPGVGPSSQCGNKVIQCHPSERTTANISIRKKSVLENIKYQKIYFWLFVSNFYLFLKDDVEAKGIDIE